MRRPRPALGLACLCLLACGMLVLAGCGGGSGTTSEVNPEAEAGKSRPAPPKSAFPAATGQTLRELIKEPGNHVAQVKIDAEAQAFYPGANRYPFTIAEKMGAAGKAGAEIPDAEAAIYYAKVPTIKPGARSKSGNKGMVSKAQEQALDQPAVGPFPARIESLATKPPFQGRTTTEDPAVASVVYSTSLNLLAGGEYRPAILIKEKNGVGAKLLPSIKVGEYAKIPRPGDKAPLIETPTAKSVGGDLAKLTTRIPPDTQNKVNYAEVLGKEPILLLFATPKFCQSRVCGPVVDVAQQAQHEFEGKANFIHMEIYNENDPSQGVRPQVRSFHLPTEPWLFAINREGVVSAAIEGAFGTELMDKTVEKVVGE
ncbi:MAG TPA: hypothetical protein VMF55_03435 [Solirubrobacterales bacterium]|nr:hypothetical protein [Solirubrobacterales bacterium]